MNIDLSNIPSTIDMLHLILAAFSIILLVLLAKKPKSNNSVSADASPAAVVEPVTPAPAAPEPKILKEATPDAALQLLTLLQQDARFIDFIKEDLSSYSDEDIGAAARVVHEGSKKTIDTYFTLEAIRNEDEESRISLPAGFNASEVRLTGNVVGGYRPTEIKGSKYRVDVEKGHKM